MSTMWNRRALLQAGGMSLAGSVLRPFAFGAPLLRFGHDAPQQPSYFLYSTVHAGSAAPEGVHVYVTEDEAAVNVQAVRSPAPSALAVSADRTMLFVANCVGTYGHRPTGSVESYAIDAKTGQLRLVSRQGLALAATYPTGLAVAPDRSMLAVVAAGGSLLTLLPIGSEGELGEPFAVRKELRDTRSSPQASVGSHVHVCFAPTGQLLAVDRARRMLSTYACEPGCIRLLNRQSLASRGATAVFQAHEGHVESSLLDVVPGGDRVSPQTPASLSTPSALLRVRLKSADTKQEKALMVFSAFTGHGSYSLAGQEKDIPAAVAWMPAQA